MIRLNIRYFLLCCIFFAVLAYIALFVSDQFIRPFLGDVLAVGWLYLLLRSFIKMKAYTLAHAALFFAYSLEIAQYFDLVTVLGLQNIRIARIVIGSTFDWYDLLAYTLGWMCIVLLESYRLRLLKKRMNTIQFE